MLRGFLSSRYTLPSMISRPQYSKRPVKVEFIGIMPTLYAHCQHCMDVMHGTGMQPYSEQLEEYPEDIVKEYFQLCEIAQKLRDEFKGTVLFDAIDTASPLGIWKSLKHRILRTPCVLIDGKKTFLGIPKYDELKEKIVERLDSSSH
jgi:hypothetical protein